MIFFNAIWNYDFYCFYWKQSIKLLCCIIEFTLVWITVIIPHSLFVFFHDAVSFDAVFQIQYFSIFSLIFSTLNSTSYILSFASTFAEVILYHGHLKARTEKNQLSQNKKFFILVNEMSLHLRWCNESYIKINQRLCFHCVLEVNFNHETIIIFLRNVT